MTATDSAHVAHTLRRLALCSLVTLLCACSTTGAAFDATALEILTPGRTTLSEAGVLLGAQPTDVYRRLDGSATARWAHKASFVPDALYFQQELWLAFDIHGHYEGVIKSVNIPGAVH